MPEPASKLDTVLQVGRTFGIRDGMLRLGYELQRGSGLLSWKMRSAQGWDAWTLNNIAPGITAERILATRRDGSHGFFFADARTLGPRFRETFQIEQEVSILADAENILQGNLPFFGALSFNCGSPPRWFENPSTGQKVSPHQPWTQMRFASPIYGDLKFILEPSRFLFVYPLVRAYALNGDECYPEGFWITIEDWARKNPPMDGPLWICGQEASLRILAWSFALQAFIHSTSTTSQRVALLVSMIAAHAWRTAQTLDYARSQRSNHLISEAVGLWTAGTLYPELKEAQLWQTLGAQLLREAVLDQITPKGVSQQHSFNYQRMILHQLLWTLRLAELHNIPLHPEISQRTEAAYDFMRTWVDLANGATPNYGSDDGSLILPLASAPYSDFRPVIQLGAAMLKRPALPAGCWDESAIWFGVNLPVANENIFSLTPPADTGYFRLGNNTSWALIRAGRYTRRPFQADQLHVDLWWKGTNLALDPGTYLYNGLPPWNNGLATAAVHNTVTIDGQDQMRRAGRFLWLDWAQAEGRVFSSSGNSIDRFEGEHNGYKRLGVTHRRSVRWLTGYGWMIIDDIEGTGQHRARLHWLARDQPFDVNASPSQLSFDCGDSQIRWNIFASVNGNAAIVRAGRQEPVVNADFQLAHPQAELLGWQSQTYGDLKPAVSLLYETCARLPVRFVTVICTDQKCSVKLQEEAIIIVREGTKISGVDLAPRSLISKN